MDTRRTLVEGAVAGVLGYVVVAAFFALVNLVAGGSPFRTAYLLGEALGAGTSGPSDAAGIVLAANGVHLLVSMALGVVSAWLVLEVERYHTLWVFVLLVFVSGFMAMVLISGIVGAEMTGIVTWSQATAASVLFAGTVAGALGWRHRTLGVEIERELGMEG